MLTEMARMSLDDGLVMQLHPGAFRNHNAQVHTRFGRDMGARHSQRDRICSRACGHCSNRFGNDARLTLIVFTLDESTYSRELAPLAGHYPALRLGPAWWFHDSPEGMMRFRETDHRDGGLLQHGRLQRRHARVPLHSHAARCGAPRGLLISRAARRRASPRRRRSPRTRHRSCRQSRAQSLQTVIPSTPFYETRCIECGQAQGLTVSSM